MNVLVQVGKSTWVDPEAIQAIEWSPFSDCPKLLLSSGLYVLATNFKDTAYPSTSSNHEYLTAALLEKIAQAMRKPTPHKFSGR